MKKTLFTLFFISLFYIAGQAEKYHLTLDESIEIAKEKSYTMQRLTQRLKIAEYNLQSATSKLKTHMYLDLGLPNYTESVKQKADSLGVYYSVKELTYSGKLKINQPLITDGNISINSGLSTFKDYYTDNRSSNFSTKISFDQPLHSFYGYNSIKSQLKKARLEYEKSDKTLKREELNLVYDVSRSYYSLLSLQKRTEIAAMDLERQTEAYEISKNKYAAGLIREVDALQMEVDLAESQSNYDAALLDQQSSINTFKELLGLDLADEISLKNELVYNTVIIDPFKAVSLALSNRLEIREKDIDIEIQKLAIKSQQSEGKVKAYLSAYFEQVGVASPTHDAKISNSLSDAFDDFKDRPSNYGIGLSISIPIFDWGENRALVRAAKARLKEYDYTKKETERSIETEVKNLVASISSNLKRLQLLEKNVSVAQKSFDITLERFSDGDIDSQALALERNRLNTAYTSHLNAYINYQLSLADLTRKTFYNFETDEAVE